MTITQPHPIERSPKMRQTLLHKAGGFTILEVLISATIIAVAVGGAISALSSLNSVAQASRLRTGAQAVAQNHIDDAINRDWSRFIGNPDNLPVPLRLGTQYVMPNMTPTVNNLPVYYDTNSAIAPFTYSPSRPGVANVPIYEEDPLTTVDGLTINAIVEIETTNVTPTGASYRLHQINVTVSYEYRGRDYEVALRTLRTSN